MTQNPELGLAEAAQRLGIPYQSCHRLVVTGQLRGTKKMGRWLVVASDVLRLLAKEKRKGLAREAIKQRAGKMTREEMAEEIELLRDQLSSLGCGTLALSNEGAPENCDDQEDHEENAVQRNAKLSRAPGRITAAI